MPKKQSPRTSDVTSSTAQSGLRKGVHGLKHLSPERAQAFLGLVRAGDLLARKLDSELQVEHAISLRGFEVLLFLAVFAPEGRLRVTELADQAPLSQSRVSRLVAELETRGLVTRSAAEDDARGVEVSITEAGRQRFLEAQKTHLEGLETRLFSRLTAEEVRELARITTKILDAEDA